MPTINDTVKQEATEAFNKVLGDEYKNLHYVAARGYATEILSTLNGCRTSRALDRALDESIDRLNQMAVFAGKRGISDEEMHLERISRADRILVLRAINDYKEIALPKGQSQSTEKGESGSAVQPKGDDPEIRSTVIPGNPPAGYTGYDVTGNARVSRKGGLAEQESGHLNPDDDDSQAWQERMEKLKRRGPREK